jgi:type IV secretion system protein VirB10
LLQAASAAPPPQAPSPTSGIGLDDLRRLALAPDTKESSPRGNAPLADALQPTLTAPAEAALVPTRRWLLPKGSYLDCTLETAIDSTLAGMTTCVLAVDAFGADGRVVLLERGTRLIGEARSDVRAGQARVQVLWSEARTPTGVVVALASPGTDALGRAGVPGAVDNHFSARFGAAILLSVIDGAISGFVAHEQGSAGLIYNPQGTRDVAADALRNTIGIPPTITVPAGARIQVLVARDVDFRTVYRLTPRGGQ